MDSETEIAKQELGIENEKQNSTAQCLELQQIKRECTDNEYMNFASEENVKVNFHVPAINNTDSSDDEFAEEKIHEKEEYDTSESLEVQEIKIEFIDVDACGEDVEFNFDVPAGNNFNESPNSQIEFEEVNMYVKEEYDTSESLEVQEIKIEFIDVDACGEDVEFNFDVPAGNNFNESPNSQIEFEEANMYVKKENDTYESLKVQYIKSEADGDACGQDVKFNFDVPAGNNFNESPNSQIEFEEANMHVKKENDTSESLEVQEIKSEVDGDTCGQDVEFNFDIPAGNNFNESPNSQIEFEEANMYVKKENDTSESLEVQDIKSETDGDACGQDVKFNFDVPAGNNFNESPNSQIEFEEADMHVKKENDTSESLEVQYIKSEVDGDAYGQDVEFNFVVPAGNNSNEGDISQIQFEEVNIYVKKESGTRESLEVQDIKSKSVDANVAVQLGNTGCKNKLTAATTDAQPNHLSVKEYRNRRSSKALQSGEHNRVYPSAEAHTCAVCNKSFGNSSCLTKHERIHSGTRPYKCTICNKTFRHLLHVTRHERTHSDSRPYECTVCKKTFKELSGLTLHERTHNGDRPYKCTVCNKSFARSGTLITHKRTHSGVRPYKCTDCNKMFAQSSHLTKHKVVHSGVRPYKCTVCNKTFALSGNLTTHKRLHSGDSPYKCSFCNKTYTTSSSLNLHERIHTGERPYECTVCNKTFLDSNRLTLHQRTHSGERPYKCTSCNMAFAKSATLVQHKGTHSDVKPYKCTVCHKAFTQSSSLYTHKRIHSGAKPYKCTVCHMLFRHSGSLAKHKLAHNDD